MIPRATALLIVVYALFHSIVAMSAELRYSARELYALVSAGIPMLERRVEGDLLHLREEPVPQEEEETRRQLEALGYVDALGSETKPSIELRIEHGAAKLDRISIGVERWTGEHCSARVVVFSPMKARLFAKKWQVEELATAGERKTLSASPAVAVKSAPLIVSLQFFRCRPVLREVVLY